MEKEYKTPFWLKLVGLICIVFAIDMLFIQAYIFFDTTRIPYIFRTVEIILLLFLGILVASKLLEFKRNNSENIEQNDEQVKTGSIDRLKHYLLHEKLMTDEDDIDIDCVEHAYISVYTIPKTFKMKVEKFRKDTEMLEYVFKQKIIDITANYDSIVLTVRKKDFVPQQADIQQNMLDGMKITIGFDAYTNPLIWDITKQPNGIISAKNGQGKTSFLKCLVSQLEQKDTVLTMFDGKKIELADFKDKHTVVTDDYITALDTFKLVLEKRMQDFKEKGIKHISETTEPYHILIIDELSFIVEEMSNDKKKTEEFQTTLTMIAKIGRSLGFSVIDTIQQAHSKYITTDFRENAHLKVMCGASSSANYTLLFGGEYSNLTPLTAGEVYVMLSGEKPQYSVFPEYK